MYKRLFLLLFLVSFVLSNAVSASDVCGPDFNVTWAYCSFGPLIKVGGNDAMITLVWDRMDERLVGGEPYYYVGYVGEYYFYFKDGELYYITNLTGGDELRYVYHDNHWYLEEFAGNSTFYVLDSKKPCLRKVTWLSPGIVKALCNATFKSKSYPVRINGSMLHISNDEQSYSIKLLHKNLTLPNLNDGEDLSAVFLREGVLIYTDHYGASEFEWNDVKVFYYDGHSLKPLNFTEALKRRLPVCNSNPLSMEKSQNQSTGLNVANQTETGVCGTGILLLLMIGPLILKKR